MKGIRTMEEKELNAKFKGCTTADELKAVAKEAGYDLTDEEASDYINKLSKGGELSDDELSNVSGGCAKWRNGKAYSGTPPHWLIVTAGNSCSLFARWEGKAKLCPNCQSYERRGAVRYCTKRTYNDDKLNP